MEVVFGGSFNPPTIAHYEIIKALSKKYDKVLILPNGKSYGRKTLIDDHYRIDMINIMIKEFNNVEVSRVEIDKEFEGTYQTLRTLNHPVFVCGDDWIENLESWIGSKELVSENRFLVLTREKTEEDIFKIIDNSSFLKSFKSHFEIMKVNLPNVSSKKFRLYYDENQVLKSVFEYIKENRLYKEDSMYSNNYLKVACASPKVKLGKPLDNAKEILSIANKYKDAAIINFPELSITGYSIGDWAHNRELLNLSKEALKEIVEASDKQIMIVGLPFEVAGNLYNCAAVIQNKKVLGIVPKSKLEETGEYVESRIFTSGKEFINDPINITLFDEEVVFGGIVFTNNEENVSFGVEIGSDMMSMDTPHHNYYLNGADMVFNLGSITYYLGKNDRVNTSVRHISSKYMGAYIYSSVNITETASDMLFVNHNMAYCNGDMLIDEENLEFKEMINKFDIDLETIRFKRYNGGFNKSTKVLNQAIVNYDLDETVNYMMEKLPDILPFVPKKQEELNEVIDIVCASLKHRLDHIGIKKSVIGISGGLDSTLALLFVYHTYNKYNMNVKDIIGITMPGFGTGTKSKSVATAIMEKLMIDARNISIKKEAQLQLKTLNHNLEQKDVTYENVQARLRTLILMNTANKESGIVIGTGDMSEIALGWSTFNGDQMSMYNLNAGLPKTTIKALVRHFITIYPNLKTELKKVCGAVISPELIGSDQATEDRIGKYEINDFLMYHLFNNGASKKRICYLLENVFNLEHVIAKNYYENFLTRFNRNQFKRLASPEGVRIFKLSFSPHGSFRYPGDMK